VLPDTLVERIAGRREQRIGPCLLAHSLATLGIKWIGVVIILLRKLVNPVPFFRAEEAKRCVGAMAHALTWLGARRTVAPMCERGSPMQHSTSRDFGPHA